MPMQEGRIYGILAVAAIVIWYLVGDTWHGIQAAPERVKTELAATIASEVMPRIKAVETETKEHSTEMARYEVDARHLAEDVTEAKESAKKAADGIDDVKQMILQQRPAPVPQQNMPVYPYPYPSPQMQQQSAPYFPPMPSSPPASLPAPPPQ